MGYRRKGQNSLRKAGKKPRSIPARSSILGLNRHPGRASVGRAGAPPPYRGIKGQNPRDGSVTFYLPTPSFCVRYNAGLSVGVFSIFLHNRGLAIPLGSIPTLANKKDPPMGDLFCLMRAERRLPVLVVSSTPDRSASRGFSRPRPAVRPSQTAGNARDRRPPAG